MSVEIICGIIAGACVGGDDGLHAADATVQSSRARHLPCSHSQWLSPVLTDREKSHALYMAVIMFPRVWCGWFVHAGTQWCIIVIMLM